MKIKLNKLFILLKLIFIFLISKCSNLIEWNLQRILLTEAAKIPNQLTNTKLIENNKQIEQTNPIVERIEIRLIENIENGSNETQLMIVDVVKKEGTVAAIIQQQQNEELIDKQINKPWFIVRIRQPYYHSTIYESTDQQNNLTKINLNNETKEFNEIKIIKNKSLENKSEEIKEEEEDYTSLEEEKNKTIKFDEKEECLINKINLDEKTLKKLLNERRRIVRTIKKINKNQNQLCRIDKRINYERVLYRKCPMWRREKFFLYYALMRITYCGNHERWPGGIYYKEN